VRLRPPDWLIYGVAVAVILTLAITRSERVSAPPAPPPVPGEAQVPVAGDSPFATTPMVAVHASALRTGATAVSAGAAGVWLTAAPNVEGCDKPGLVVADGRAVPAKRAALSGKLRVLTTVGGAPGLPLAGAGDLRPGETGFAAGFPEGEPGEVALRLIGPVILRTAPRIQPNGLALAWAEVGHTEGLAGARMGLVGAPVMDTQGRVAGMVLSQAPRRGLVFTSLPDDARRALAKTPLGASAQPEPIGADNYGRVADDLRRSLAVIQLVCLS
jgi:S1-C subfamily serine protease